MRERKKNGLHGFCGAGVIVETWAVAVGGGSEISDRILVVVCL